MSFAPPSNQPETDLPTYWYSLPERVIWAVRSLKLRLWPRRHLIAGPFAGEFGYEAMQWQAFVRGCRPRYASVHVITYPGRDYFYEGCTVHAHDVLLPEAGYGYGRMSPAQACARAHRLAAALELRDYDVFIPAHLCTQHHKRLFWRADFRLFQEPPLDGQIREVAFHFRAVRKAGPDQAKNYSPALAEEVVRLCREQGWQVSCIGHPEYALCPPGAVDHRRLNLQETVAAICGVRLVSGENSGPMHLANLCGKPTVLWAEGQWRIDYSLRWNPFRVPIYTATADTCQPAPSLVVATLRHALEDLRQKTGDFSAPAHVWPAQPIPGY